MLNIPANLICQPAAKEILRRRKLKAKVVTDAFQYRVAYFPYNIDALLINASLARPAIIEG
jgi:hypothetical protein